MSMIFERRLIIAAVVTLIAVLVIDTWHRRLDGSRWLFVSTALAVASSLLVAAITTRWLREAQGPFLTLYDVLLSNLFSLAVVYLVSANLVPALRDGARFVLAFLVLLGAWCLNVSPATIPLPATFDNPWLWLHVLSGKLFLGLCLAAAATAALLIVRQRRPAARPVYPGDMDSAVWLTMSLAFVCHSFMLIAGAIWAHSAWGRYWAWDSLETWTFITWLCIALLLHVRVTFRRIPPAVGWSAVLVIFGLAVLTFLGVPFVSSAPHKGVM